MNEHKINKCGCGGEAVQFKNCVLGGFYVGVKCQECGNNSSSFPKICEAIEAWNTAHPEHNAIASVREVLSVLQDGKDSCAMSGDLFNQVEDMLLHLEYPEISDAQQAIKWLEEGKKIVEIEENNYNAGTHFYEVDEDKKVICVDVENKSYDSTDNFFSQLLFSSTWQLYEEPKYKEITSDEALINFSLHGENKKIVLVSRGQEFYITRIDNTIKFSSLSNPLGGMDKSREQLQGLQWRIYEN